MAIRRMSASSISIPPNGFVGDANQTMATQRMFQLGQPAVARPSSGASTRRRRRKTTAAAPSRRSGGKRKLPKFGSPAWRKKFGLGKKRRK